MSFTEPHPALGLHAAGIMQVHNEQTVDPKHLHRSLASLKRLCHTIIVYDDGSDDGTDVWLRTVARGAGLVTHLIRSEENDWRNELAHKSAMVKLAHRLNAQHVAQERDARDRLLRPHPIEWLIWLDADEELSPGAHDGILEHAQDDGISGIYVKELNLWRDPYHYRVDSKFDDPASGWFLRVWRMHDELHYGEVGRGLHQTQFPASAAECPVRLDPAAARVVHYSWDSPKKIDAKNQRYALAGDHDSIPRMLDGDHVQRVQAPASYFWVPQPRWKPALSDDGVPCFLDRALHVGAWRTGGFFRLAEPETIYDTEAELMHVVGGRR